MIVVELIKYWSIEDSIFFIASCQDSDLDVAINIEKIDAILIIILSYLLRPMLEPMYQLLNGEYDITNIIPFYYESGHERDLGNLVIIKLPLKKIIGKLVK